MPDLVDGRRALAAALLAAALAGYVTLLGRLRAFERAAAAADEVPWWFGYARDAVNLAGAGALLLAFAASGLPGAGALLVGVLLALLAYVVDWATGRWLALRRARLVTLAIALAAGGALIARAPSVADAIARLLSSAAPR